MFETQKTLRERERERERERGMKLRRVGEEGFSRGAVYI